MNPDNEDEVRTAIAKAGNLNEVYKVTTYRGYTEEGLPVRVDIADQGEGHRQRFAITATAPGRREATGNPEADLDMALEFVHWKRLKQEEN